MSCAPRYGGMQRFTLIEVLMAIVIAGIGIVSLIGFMFTVVTTGRDAAIETRVALISSEFSHYISHRATADWSAFIDTSDGTFAVPVESGGTYNRDELTDLPEDPSWQSDTDSNFFDHSTRPGLYKIVEADGFTASIRIWQDAVVSSVVDPTGAHAEVEPADSDAAALHVEVSWPMSKSYTSRRRWLFYTTVLNPTP